MIKKNKNKEGKIKNNGKLHKKMIELKDRAKKIKTTSSQKIVHESEREGMTLGDIKNKEGESNKIQNLISILIIVSGLFAGSLFVDIAQIVIGGGYSEKALRKADIFELGDKTWVAYDEPAIKVDILVADDQEACVTCNPDEILGWMKKFIPTMAVNKVPENSSEGKSLIEKYDLKTIPSFVFSDKVQEASFFKEEQVKEIFDRKADGLVLNSTALGVPAGKYLEVPAEKDGDIVIGNKDSQVKLLTFFDFQCPYSKIFYEAAKEARAEFSGDQLVLVYKSFPLDSQGQAISASLAGQCAYKQGRFEEMADLLFANQEKWSVTEDFKIFDQYALKIGLNKVEFDACVNDEGSRNLILELIEQGDQFGIAGTPSSFVGDEFLNGIFQKEDIVALIKSKLN